MSALRAPAVAPDRSTTSARPRRAPLTALPGGAGERGRRLDVVRAPLQSASGIPFYVLCAAILAGALLVALLLNTTMARGSYEMARLQKEVGQVAQDVQDVEAQLRAAEASLPDRARQMGMVPAENPTMISVATGEVVAAPQGEPEP
jgi:outer membrane murein-binding lipoprotein Lpp